VDDLSGIDQPRDHLAADAEGEVALHASADNSGELAARSLSLSGSGDAHQRRVRARISFRPSTTGKKASYD
jgi:hypothetical protein